jgi:hypothetical protein
MYRHGAPVSRIVVVGDVHGDLAKARECARIAGLVRADGSWRDDVAPGTVVVQVGDQIDGAPRLPDSRRPAGSTDIRGFSAHDCAEAIAGDLGVLAYFDALDRGASLAGRGCRVYSLLGNHEMNSADGNTDYADVCERCRDRRAAVFARGGAVARRMAATRRACLEAGGVLFAHAGVRASHIPFLPAADAAASAFLAGDATPAQVRLVRQHLTGPEGMLCHRGYAPDDPAVGDAEVQRVLAAAGCNAMVLGHNAHSSGGGVSQSHGGRVWVVDPGMSSSIFGAPAAVLDIAVAPDGELTVRTLRSRGP